MSPLSRGPFRGLFAGQVVSIAGDRFNYFALVALLSAHARRAGHGPEGVLALLAWAMLAPALLLSPWAGAIVDRLPLVRVLVWTDLARALVVAAIPLAYAATGSTTPVFALIALAFSLNCFFLPARSALPPHLVDPAELASANALLVLGGVLATLVGAALGGPLVDRFGPSPALYLDAFTYLVSVLCLASLLFQGVEGRTVAAGPPRHPLREAREGWSIVVTSRGARAPMISSVATWIAGGVLSVAGTAHVLGGGSKVGGLGLLVAALAVGAALGSWWTLSRPRPDHTVALARGLAGAGLGLAFFAWATAPWSMTLAAFATGIFAAPVFFLSETAIQEAVPEGARARVFSARDFLARGAFLIMAAIAAPLVSRYGTALPIAATGGIMGLLGLGTLLQKGGTRS